MTNNLIGSGLTLFYTKTGQPLENGKIYIGDYGLNPETNPKAIFWDSALTISASQPVSTISGYPDRNGSPTGIFTDGTYSVTVRDRTGSLVYSDLYASATVSIPATDGNAGKYLRVSDDESSTEWLSPASDGYALGFETRADAAAALDVIPTGTLFTAAGLSYQKDDSVGLGASAFNDLGAAAVVPAGAVMYASQWGCGTSSDGTFYENALAYTDTISELVIDVDVTLPGQNTSASLPFDDVTIRFIGGHGLVYDFDGASISTHSYMYLGGRNGVRLYDPYIRNSVAAVTRTAQPAIWLDGCTDCIVYRGHVDGTTGAGFFIQGGSDNFVHDSLSENTLADGFHIRGNTAGGALNCWTFNCKSSATGDDGAAIVSYEADGGQVENCGHIGFTSLDSGARGMAAIGGLNCRMTGDIYRAEKQGFLMRRDNTFSTNYPIGYELDIRVFEHTGVSGAVEYAAVELSNGFERASGRVESVDAGKRGVQISGSDGAIKDFDLTVVASGSQGNPSVQIENASRFTIRPKILDAGQTAMITNDCSKYTLSEVHIDNFGTLGGPSDGLRQDTNSEFVVSGGYVITEQATADYGIDAVTLTNGIYTNLVVRVAGTARRIRTTTTTNVTVANNIDA